MKTKKYILMLEPDQEDRDLSRQYYEENAIHYEFIQLSSELIPVLTGKTERGEALPSVLVISMHSSPEWGLDALRNIRKHQQFAHLPVVILGENTQPDLVKRCYQEGANTFINKPFGDKLTDLKVKTFLTYWFEVAEVPVIKPIGEELVKL